VRLHATKDYTELPALHREFPRLRLTYNISPILLEQICAYRDGILTDRAAELSQRSGALEPTERAELLEWAFVGNVQRMIEPFQRYRQLFQEHTAHTSNQWGSQEWLDLCVWMRLAWLGQTVRDSGAIARLFQQGEHFTADDLAMLCSVEQELLGLMMPRLAALERWGLAELSVNPYYHPILPLLCTTDIVARSDLGLERLETAFAWREDAVAQVQMAIDAISPYRSRDTMGMWLSEGSISDDALGVLTECGVQWTASDQVILKRTLGSDDPIAHYRPYRWQDRSGRQIIVLFRDHALSDAIGFVYSSWDAHAAAQDFLARLRAIRSMLIDRLGESALQSAVVPIILDGENCWEYYPHNGALFLRALYAALTSDEEFETVTFGAVAQAASASADTPQLEHLEPGSWIDGQFRIWIGHAEDRRAWELLQASRTWFATVESQLDQQARAIAYRHLLTAEGSDWFWWFGDEHRAAFRHVFDVLFRYHVTEAYRAMGISPPADLSVPIMADAEPGGQYGAMQPFTPPSESRRGG
jgi:alpha-amylase/alpha-mannosidase (GH57 family)